MVLLNQETRLLTGSSDSELRAWDISYLQEVSRDMNHGVERCFHPFSFFFLLSSVSLPPAQAKAEGEPEVKKGKTELEEEEEEEDKEGVDESPEEVQNPRVSNCYMEHLYNHLYVGQRTERRIRSVLCLLVSTQSLVQHLCLHQSSLLHSPSASSLLSAHPEVSEGRLHPERSHRPRGLAVHRRQVQRPRLPRECEASFCPSSSEQRGGKRGRGGGLGLLLKVILLRQGNDSVLEVFRVLPEAEVQQKMKKKEKKAKKKAAQ